MPFLIEPSSEISHRAEFAHLCNARGYTDAVEVGVDLGVNARDFLSRFEGNWLIGVDPYLPFHSIPGSDRAADLLAAVQALAPYHGRFRIFMARSVDVAAHYPVWLKDPDLVYLDAGHLYADVRSDIEAWWPRLATGGILGGHDFCDRDHPGVVRAVTEFAEARGLVVRLTHEAETPSWYVYKGGEPATLKIRHFRHAEEANPHAAGEG